MRLMGNLPARAARAGIAVAALAFGLSAAQSAAAAAGANIVVTTQANDIDVNGNCTLYEAIEAANTNTAVDLCPAGTTGLDQITFAPGVTTIDNSFGSFPAFTSPVSVDGTVGSAPGVTITNTKGSGMVGLVFLAGAKGSTLRGVKIAGFDLGVSVQADNTTLVNNWIGTSDGTTAAGSLGTQGIEIIAKNVRIGSVKGAAAPEGNLIVNQDAAINVWPPSSGVIIQGNRIGTTADGTAALLNHTGIADRGIKTLIGGTKPGQGNLIAASTVSGIVIEAAASKTTVQRNWIGVTADGLSSLANQVGILAYGAQGALIGGPMPSASNIIAGNTAGIQVVDSGVGPKTMLTVTGNIIGLNANGSPLPNATGIDFELGAQTMKVKVNGNLIAGNTVGLGFTNAFAPVFASSTGNCIQGNTTGLDDTTSQTVTSVFQKNWWGDATGPSGSYAGIGDSAQTSFVDVSRFLTKAPLSCLGFAPRSVTPEDNSFFNRKNSQTTLSWSKVATANGYDTPIGTLPGPSGLFDAGSGPGNSFKTGPLDYGAYYWQVHTATTDHVFWLGPQHVFYVTIMKGPKPGFVAPSQTVTLAWSAYPGAASYSIQIYTGGGCAPGNESGAPLTVSGLSEFIGFGTGGLRSWTLQPDNGPVMPCWNFTTQ